MRVIDAVTIAGIGVVFGAILYFNGITLEEHPFVYFGIMTPLAILTSALYRLLVHK